MNLIQTIIFSLVYIKIAYQQSIFDSKNLLAKAILSQDENHNNNYIIKRKQFKKDLVWKRDRYDGEYKNGKIDGKGKYYYSNGDEYDGEWKDDKRHGKGKYEASLTGEMYVGEWKDDEKDGDGVFYNSYGGKYKGRWKNGKNIERGELDVSFTS